MAGEESGGSRGFLVLLAPYFSGRQALAGYAADLLAALRDDGVDDLGGQRLSDKIG